MTSLLTAGRRGDRETLDKGARMPAYREKFQRAGFLPLFARPAVQISLVQVGAVSARRLLALQASFFSFPFSLCTPLVSAPLLCPLFPLMMMAVESGCTDN